MGGLGGGGSSRQTEIQPQTKKKQEEKKRQGRAPIAVGYARGREAMQVDEAPAGLGCQRMQYAFLKDTPSQRYVIDFGARHCVVWIKGLWGIFL